MNGDAWQTAGVLDIFPKQAKLIVSTQVKIGNNRSNHVGEKMGFLSACVILVSLGSQYVSFKFFSSLKTKSALEPEN